MSQLCNACIRISIIIEKRKQLTRQHTNTLPPVCKWRRRRPRRRRRRLQRSTYYYHNAVLVYTRMRARTKPMRCLVIWLVILSIVDCRSRVSALQPITASAISLMRLCFAKIGRVWKPDIAITPTTSKNAGVHLIWLINLNHA